MKKKSLIVAALITSSQLFSQEKDSLVTSLGEVTVTATKFPTKQNQTGKVVTVINRDQLEKNAGRTISEILNQQAGISINGGNNPLGSNQTIYLRGGNAGNTLILVDGIPAYDASGISGEFDINHFNPDQVERIEILKGAQSTAYGSDAQAGVINIITRKKQGNKPVYLNANLSAGSYATWKGGFDFGVGTDETRFNLMYTKTKSNGFSSANDSVGNKGFDKESFDQDLFRANFSSNVTKQLLVRTFIQFDDYKAGLDQGAFNDEKDYTVKSENLQIGAGATYSLKHGALYFNYNYNTINRQYIDDSAQRGSSFSYYSDGRYKGVSRFAELYGNYSFGKYVEILAGGDWRDGKTDQTYTSVSSFGPYESPALGDDSANTHQVSAFASLILKNLGGFGTEIGGRYNHHSVYKNNFTYTINPYFLIGERFKVFASVSSAFKAPGLYYLFSPYGNKSLKPEESTGYEGGLQYSSKRIEARVVYFNRTIKNVIIFKSLSAAPYGVYENADKQQDNGVELELKVKPVAGLTIEANYTFVDGEITTSSANTGKDTTFFNLFRRPKHSINAIVGYQYQRLFASIGVRYVSKRDDVFYNSNTFGNEQTKLAAYQTINFFASYKAAKWIRLFADLKNITNEKYFDQYGFNTRRFNATAGVNLYF
ncbi:MAG: TonB-dependent receptor [Gemmatimonadaceae bacterium]|nr:TonB-dependent receptor [Chitinophagaceae bacterium]